MEAGRLCGRESRVARSGPFLAKVGGLLIGLLVRPAVRRPLRCRANDGFALVVVIWAIGVFALLFATYVTSARHRSIEALTLSERARAEAMVGIAISSAILDLLTASTGSAAQNARFPRDGTPVLCTIGGQSKVALAVSDEAGKVDLNTGSPELLQALLNGLLPRRSDAVPPAKFLLDMREAAAAAQNARGVAGEAPTALVSVYEIDQVVPVSRELLQTILPMVTVHSRSSGVDPRVAPLDLLKAISPGSVSSREDARRSLPSSFAVDSPGRTFLISGEAMVSSNARASRDAVVQIAPDLPSGYQILEWREGSLTLAAQAASLLPPCLAGTPFAGDRQ